MTPTSTGDLRPVYLFDILEPFDLPEYKKGRSGQQDREQDDNHETMRHILHVDRDVHPVEASD